jgi:hypothetical protein
MLRRTLRLIILPILFSHACLALAQDRATASKPTDACHTFESRWNEVEKMTWTDLCRNGYAAAGHLEVPGTPELSGAFISDITRLHPYSESIGDAGIELEGYSLKDLDLTDRIVPAIRLYHTSVESIILKRATINGPLMLIQCDVHFLGLNATHVKGDLLIESDLRYLTESDSSKSSDDDSFIESADSSVDGNLTISGGRYYKIDLSGTNIEGRVSLSSLDLTRASKSDNTWILNAHDVILKDLHVTKDFNFNQIKAQFADLQNMNIGDVADLEFVQVPLVIAKGISVGKDFYFSHSDLHDAPDKNDDPDHSIPDWLYMGGATIGRSLIIRDVSTWKAIDASLSSIGSNVLLSGNKLRFLDLSGSKITGVLMLAPSTIAPRAEFKAPAQKHYQPLWQEVSMLKLTGTAIGEIAAPLDLSIWPSHLDLRGFTLQQFLPGDNIDAALFALRAVSWFPRWLERDMYYSPQPYKETSEMLKRVGSDDASVAVAYMSKEKQLGLACNYIELLECVGLLLSKATIGYGYKLYRAFEWSIFVIFVGMAVFKRSPEGKDKDLAFAFVYSFDHFIPAIKLREENFDLRLNGPSMYYFYFHKVMGWVLVSFIIAGLSGLTK